MVTAHRILFENASQTFVRNCRYRAFRMGKFDMTYHRCVCRKVDACQLELTITCIVCEVSDFTLWDYVMVAAFKVFTDGWVVTYLNLYLRLDLVSSQHFKGYRIIEDNIVACIDVSAVVRSEAWAGKRSINSRNDPHL